MRFLFLISLFALFMASCDVKNSSHKVKLKDSNVHKIDRITLKDTEFVKGNSAIFLRPDSIRFESYVKEGEEIYEVDSDFGFGISAAIDSMERNSIFKNIKPIISDKRYVALIDCKECPILIDRDSIDYGIIFTKVGKSIHLQRSQVFAPEGFLDSILEYFELN